MYFTLANVEASLAGSREEAERIVFGSGVAPCWTLVVNAKRHPSVDSFLRAAKAMRHAFDAAAGSQLVEGRRVRIARVAIGASTNLGALGWAGLDAVLMADSFERLADVLDEVADSSS